MEALLDNPYARIGLALVVLVVVVKLVSRLFAKQAPASPNYVQARCPSCGWQGAVGKYNRKCSNCRGDVEVLPSS